MRKIGLAIMLVSLATAGAFAQSGNDDYNIMGAGARAHGMGGAFIGVADDATAIGWNPAGIAQLEKMEASINGLFNMKKYHEEITWTSGGGYKKDDNINHFAPSFASFIFPLKAANHNLVLGVAYQRMIDMGAVSSDTGHVDALGRYDYEDKMTGGLDAISPAMAYQITPMISIGAAGNILLNGFEEEFKKTYTNGTDDFTHTHKFSGFNINTGALINTQKFNIGATLRLPFTITDKYKLTNSRSVPGFTEWPDTTYPDSKFTMPLMIGVGVAIKPTDKFTLAADFESRGYSKSEVTETIESWNGSGWVLKDTTYNAEMKNCNQFRVGLEYIFSGANAVFPVRLGFRTDPKTYNKWQGSFTNLDTVQAVGKVFTGGFGLIMGRVMLDLAYEFGMTDLWDVSGGGGEAKRTEAIHNIMASCIFHF